MHGEQWVRCLFHVEILTGVSTNFIATNCGKKRQLPRQQFLHDFLPRKRSLIPDESYWMLTLMKLFHFLLNSSHKSLKNIEDIKITITTIEIALILLLQ
jgi:hypothetical protein